jgi:membrane protein DedA with SNARE-associated domain
MRETLQFVVRHGYTLIFFWLLAEQAAVPVPSIPLLIVSGALARSGQLRVPPILMSALAGCVIADNMWFQIGRQFGGKALQFICRMSLEPDSCVRRTENIFVKYGLRALLVSKFIPGLSAIAAPLAGGSRAKFGRFLVFDCLGALTWIGSYVLLGYLFSDQLEDALGYAIRMGSSFVLLVISLFIVWIVWKYVERRRFLKSVDIARISAQELDAMLSSGIDVTVVDVRSQITLDENGLIPGALRIPTEDLAVRHREIPRDREIVLFCT